MVQAGLKRSCTITLVNSRIDNPWRFDEENFLRNANEAANNSTPRVVSVDVSVTRASKKQTWY